MFDLFKKSTVTKQVEIVKTEVIEVKAFKQVVKTKDTKEIIKQIHSEFNIAGELLLKEAKETIDRCSEVNTEKGDRLTKIGFSQTTEAEQSNIIRNQKEAAKKKAELIQYYSTYYPNNKFIDESSVRKICEKYNLVYGEISRYKGFVPEKNLSEIEAFKLREEDYTYTEKYYDDDGRGSIITKEEYEDKQRHRTSHWSYHCFKESFSICAPLKDMQVSSREKVVDHKIVPIPDPVVLQSVKGGYLIVTAWGDEQNDPEVVNEKMN